MTHVFNTPIALVSLVDEDKVFFKGNIGMPGVKFTDRNISLCSFAILSPEPTIFSNPLNEPCLLAGKSSGSRRLWFTLLRITSLLETDGYAPFTQTT